MNNLFANITLTTRQPLSFSHHSVEGLPLLTRGIDSEGRHQKTVFWPAAALRGRIRHDVALSVLEKEGKVKLSRAYMTALGQSTDGVVEDESRDVTYKIGEAQALREKDPVLDLFGTWKINSRLQVSHLLPEVNVQPDRVSFIRRDLDSNEDLMELLDESEQATFYDRQALMSQASKMGDMIKLAKRQLMAAKKANDTTLVEALQAKIDQFGSLQKSQRGEAGGDGNTTKHLLEVEMIPAGIDLLGTLVVQKAKPRDLAMLLEAFNRISLQPRFGAHQARGCGEVEGKATLTNSDGEVLVVARFGGFKPVSLDWTETGKRYAGH